MTVIDKLATSLNRRDEGPNVDLAATIAHNADHSAIRELVQNLNHKNKGIRHDCIKVLYEAGERNPKLIACYWNEFGALLESKDNRLQWGAMTALDTIALEEPAKLYKMLPKILDVADKGSVISRDHAVGILIKLASVKLFHKACSSLLLEQLAKCPNNQFPMYIENSLGIINGENRARFRDIATARIDRLDKESQKKRVRKASKRIG